MTITPEVSSRSINRAIIAEFVRLYRETDLGMRLPAYDGRKSLYTVGSLPFTSKEFTIKLLEEDGGITRLIAAPFSCFFMPFVSFSRIVAALYLIQFCCEEKRSIELGSSL